jgi:hypothetical protein
VPLIALKKTVLEIQMCNINIYSWIQWIHPGIDRFRCFQQGIFLLSTTICIEQARILLFPADVEAKNGKEFGLQPLQ